MILLITVLISTYLVMAYISLYPIIFQLLIISKSQSIKPGGNHVSRDAVNQLYVVIPAKSEPLDVLEDAMRRFSEIKPIFILDNYPRELRPIIEGMATKYGVKVMFRDKAVGYKGGALNHVIKRLELPGSSYMVVFDVDSSTNPNTIKLLLSYASNYDAVVPRWVIKNDGKSQLARGQWIGYLLFFKVMKGLQELINWVPILGSGSVVNVGSLKRVGYWPEDVLEDVELGVKFFINGLRIHYVDDAVIYVDAPTNYWGFLIQQIRWGFGAARVLKKYFSSIINGRGGLIVALYLGQYLGYLFQLIALLLLVIITILNIALPLWSFITLVIVYIPTLSTYLYQLLSLSRESGGDVIRDAFAVNAVNLAFLMAMPRLAIASLMGLTGIDGIEWVPTPKGSVVIKHGIRELTPELATTFLAVLALILALLRGLWFNVLIFLPYVAGFVRGLWRILNGTL